MNIEITKADLNDALASNGLLTKLIIDEKKYDENINEKCVVKSLYENFFENEDICLFVAKEENIVVGYIYGFIQNNGDAKIKKVAALDALYVEEEFRNKKIATKLIEEFKKWVRKNNVSYIELKVCKENNNAIKLYENSGFITDKIIMKYKVDD